MRNIKPITYISVIFFVLALAGCVKPLPPITELSKANARFLEICKEEYGLEPLIKNLKDTLYIYLPVEDSIYDFKVLDTAGATNAKTVSVKVKDGSLSIDYNAKPKQAVANDFGYNIVYAEEFTKKQRNALQALYRAYGDLGEKDIPSFIVFIIADIKRGLESKAVFYYSDYKRYMMQAINYDEYSKRHISEPVRGDKKIINDLKGRHIDYENITMQEFLAKQIQYRIQTRQQRNLLGGSDSAEADVRKIIDETLKAYGVEELKVNIEQKR